MREGNFIAVMSTSPTKSEGGFASPGLQPPRRTHRRGVSGAISTNDLPYLHSQPDFLMPRGNSAPNSPVSFHVKEVAPIPLDDQPPALPEPARPVPKQSIADTVDKASANDFSVPVPASPLQFEQIPRLSRNGRARVGFSDTLEFIPRPLSLVSSDTSSTVTALPGHSVSGSISSIISAPSPLDRDSPALLTRSSTLENYESRPSTAGAILEGFASSKPADGGARSPRRRNSIPLLFDVAQTEANNSLTTPSPVKTCNKRWSFFGLDPFVNSAPFAKHRSCNSSSSDSLTKAVSKASSSDADSDSSDDEATGEDASGSSKKECKKTRKKNRVKGWAGSILPLRSSRKRSKMHAVRPPTPPASVGPADPEEQEKKETDVCGSEALLHTPTVIITESRTVAKDDGLKRRAEEDGAYPMIDLDAALGPFNTPLPQNPEWDAAQRAAGNAGRRRLHSAQGMKGFSGPGMHYHRRAESAPDLPPFDLGHAGGIHRFGSSSTMADVFEEDEEDDDDDEANDSEHHDVENVDADGSEPERSGNPDGEATPPAMAISVSDASADAANESSTRHEARQAGCGTRSKDLSAAVHAAAHAERSESSLKDGVAAEESSSTMFCPASSLLSWLPADAQDSASSSPRLTPGYRELSTESGQVTAMNNAVAMPASPYSTSHASSYPSPRSPMSIDAQRISTAPSSVADGSSFHSLLMGEPGPEVRISADYDMPSLTSSTTTITRESTFIPMARMSQPSLGQQRPVSVSSAAFGHRRASLVSLSRLISTSHGERSKLSVEATLDNDAEAKQGRWKSSKSKRLSRIMQFWKPSKGSSPP